MPSATKGTFEKKAPWNPKNFQEKRKKARPGNFSYLCTGKNYTGR